MYTVRLSPVDSPRARVGFQRAASVPLSLDAAWRALADALRALVELGWSVIDDSTESASVHSGACGYVLRRGPAVMRLAVVPVMIG